MPSQLFVANWKMAKNFSDAIDFCTTHKDKLQKLANLPNTQIVLCPSFPALFSAAEILSDTMVDIGAQNCSPHESGPYTGQVSVESIAQTGCTHCIIGHSEQRARGATNEEIAQQLTTLIKHNLEPIICIGESKESHDNGTTTDDLQRQLALIMPLLASASTHVTIAYEPIWAIGTGVTPDEESLNTIFSWLASQVNSQNKVRLIYGGSVSDQNAAKLSNIAHISGFLIGGDSLNFQKFEKIVSLAT